MSKNIPTAVFAFGAAMIAWFGAAHAQSAPQQTTATYQDWIVRCELRPGPPPVKSCATVQFSQVQGQSGVFTQISIANPRQGEALKLVFQVPIEVWLPTGVRLAIGESETGLSATFKRCAPNACFADVEIKDDSVKNLRSGAETGKFQFKDTNQKDVIVPVSFKGFGAAFDAMRAGGMGFLAYVEQVLVSDLGPGSHSCAIDRVHHTSGEQPNLPETAHRGFPATSRLHTPCGTTRGAAIPEPPARQNR